MELDGQIAAAEIVDTIREGLLILSEDLSVEFASRNFMRMFSVTSDQTVGRKIYDLGDGQWDIPDLRRLLEEIIPQSTTIESFKVEHDFPDIGRRVMRINARKTFRSGDNSLRILLAVEDITMSEDTARELGRQQRLMEGVVDTLREILLVLDSEQRVIAASRSFYKAFKTTPEETIGARLEDLGDGQWNIDALKQLISHIVPDNGEVEDFEVDHEFPKLGRRQMLLNARKIFREGNNTKTILLAIEDVTEQRRIEAERAAALERSRGLLDELNHRVMNSLTVIGAIMSMESRHMSDTECKAAFERIKTRVMAVGDLYKTLSRASAVESVAADAYLGVIAQDIVKALSSSERSPVALTVNIAPIPLTTSLAVPLGLMLNELMTNSLKYAFDEEKTDAGITVRLAKRNGELELTVEDNGRGIDKNARVDSGVGQRLIEAFASQLSGEIDRKSDTNGTSVRLTFPYA